MSTSGFLGLPSLHSIIEAIASGFFGALAKALVPSWLTHGTVGTIQQLVALPDPAQWPHVGALQGETTYLGAMLAPVTLSAAALRYWTVGLTGSAHPASAVARCAAATGVLVAYRWIVEQAVAATNTVTHGLLGLPSVAAGLSRIIAVLFGGALLSGAGGVFGAFLVIIGVVFAAGLFATQILLTVVLAVLIVAGPPLIALAAIPELSHLARAWRDALLTVVLIPLGWTVLFATAGALCLDATSFTGAAGGLPSHVAAAFAGLITFALAVKLPLMALGELRHTLSRTSLSSHGAQTQMAPIPGAERVRSAHARLRAIGLEGVPALGASVGAAAGALGAPAGGALGAARRGLARAAGRHGPQAPPRTPGAAGAAGGDHATPRRSPRQRVADAKTILARAPREAAAATRRSMRAGSRTNPTKQQGRGSGSDRAPVRQHAQGSGAVAGAKPAGAARGAAVMPAPALHVQRNGAVPSANGASAGLGADRTPRPGTGRRPPSPPLMHVEQGAASQRASTPAPPPSRPTRPDRHTRKPQPSTSTPVSPPPPRDRQGGPPAPRKAKAPRSRRS